LDLYSIDFALNSSPLELYSKRTELLSMSLSPRKELSQSFFLFSFLRSYIPGEWLEDYWEILDYSSLEPEIIESYS
jgi:hypothetical protein